MYKHVHHDTPPNYEGTASERCEGMCRMVSERNFFPVYCLLLPAHSKSWHMTLHSSSVCNRLCWTWVMVSIFSQCKGTVHLLLCTHVCTRQYHYSATWICTEALYPYKHADPHMHYSTHTHTHTQEGGSVSRPGGRGSTQKDRNLIIYFSVDRFVLRICAGLTFPS